MEKVIQEIKVVETDKGLRIEVEGEGAKEWAQNISACLPGLGVACCCAPEPRKKGK